jgi:hypothetical protein
MIFTEVFAKTKRFTVPVKGFIFSDKASNEEIEIYIRNYMENEIRCYVIDRYPNDSIDEIFLDECDTLEITWNTLTEEGYIKRFTNEIEK